MSGFFGCISRKDVVADVFYGTDYHSHLGTKRGGLAFYTNGRFVRSIHSLESAYFRNKFEPELDKFFGSHVGIGIISDKESQPITITSTVGRFSIATIGRIDNIDFLVQEMINNGQHFTELSESEINATELIAIIIGASKTITEGVKKVQDMIQGSCSMLILTEDALYAARDKYGRTPIVIGKDDMGFVAAFESSSFSNLGYDSY
ncbi:MAG: amidophosphoribosyltransferase, partial [Rikenellaceae bacterium]